MIVKTNFLPNGVELPYAIKVDNPEATIGVFGDSFAQLSEFKNHPNVNNFDHESSWIYFLANILNMNCETFGVSKCGMGDIFHTLLLNTKKYDYYILVCTFPPRKNIFGTIKYDIKTCKKIKEFISDKKVLIVYWDERHKLFDFEKPFMISNFHMTNANRDEPSYGEMLDAKPNKLDQLDGLHHMSARGNLLFALKLSKLLIANYLKN
tara:strand:- start:104 stop:727 length:624 start_codon:yes stop_codon:yes gene_type:complete